jgi:hypothetical protein
MKILTRGKEKHLEEDLKESLEWDRCYEPLNASNMILPMAPFH